MMLRCRSNKTRRSAVLQSCKINRSHRISVVVVDGYTTSIGDSVVDPYGWLYNGDIGDIIVNCRGDLGGLWYLHTAFAQNTFLKLFQ